MTEWTPAARDEFDRYCASVRDTLARGGADPAEVFEDLKAHVDREAAAMGLALLTLDHLRQVLARIGPVADRGTAPLPPASVSRAQPIEKRPWFQWVCGVVLPAITILTEAVSGWCASVFFDPLPTPAHLLLASSVPALNAWVLLQLRQESLSRPRLVQAASGAAMGVAFLYTIPFLVLLPIAVIGLVVFGLGLLPLTPPLAFIASIRVAGRVRRTLGAGWPGRAAVYGFLVAVLASLLADLPKTATHLGLRMAMSEDSSARRRGISLLRTLGSEEYLLRACYDRSGLPADLVSFMLLPVFSGSANPEDVRSIYYRVSGRPFNTVPPPHVSGLRRSDPTRLWDFDRAGTGVGATLKGLSLASSRLDGSVDADAAVAYVEWTFEFRNENRPPSEARAQIVLPPGGVVTRVTLWIEGEEREAAFGGRAAVRQAYENVVRARRDPILVTTSGPDRILVQCFPVNPGQVMKARLGITAPLLVDDPAHGVLVLPRFIERNFAVAENVHHAVWIETKGRFAGTREPYTLEPLAAGGQALRGAASEAMLAGAGRTIEVGRDPARLEAWAPGGGDVKAVRQTLRPRVPASVKRLVVVLDGSRGGSEAAPALATALRRIPEAVEVAVLLASDQTIVLAQARAGGKGAASALSQAHFVGGVDNVPALVQAWDLAAASPHGRLLWVHASQPVRLGGASDLAQRWTRRPNGPRLLAIAIADGPNHVLAELGDVSAISTWPRRGALAADLASAIDRLVGPAAGLEAVREAAGKTPDLALVSTSGHVLRLWAADQVRAALAEGDASSRKTATALAVRHRLVTPVSGAVVLETRAQYAQAGLEPPGAETVPTIPEPETWVLLAIVASFVWLALRRRSSLAA